MDYKIFAYLVYKDPVELNVIPDPLLPANTIFHISTVPPLESGVVLKKVANQLESVKGGWSQIFNTFNLLMILKLLMFFLQSNLSGTWQWNLMGHYDNALLDNESLEVNNRN